MSFKVSYYQSPMVGNVAVEIEIKKHNFFSEAAAEAWVKEIKDFVKHLDGKDGQQHAQGDPGV